MRIDSRFQNLDCNVVFKAFSDTFNTITFKIPALKVDDVGEGLRTGPESKYPILEFAAVGPRLLIISFYTISQ